MCSGVMDDGFHEMKRGCGALAINSNHTAKEFGARGPHVGWYEREC